MISVFVLIAAGVASVSVPSCNASSAINATIAAVMIVRNEAYGIEATLRSLMCSDDSDSNGLDLVVIADTGSSDGTMEIATRLRDEARNNPSCQTQIELARVEFHDFSQARNAVVDLVETNSSYFPAVPPGLGCERRPADFLLTVDADDELRGASALRQFCDAVKRGRYDCRSSGCAFVRPQSFLVMRHWHIGRGMRSDMPSEKLARAGHGWRWRGAVHEHWQHPDGRGVAGDGASLPEPVPGVVLYQNRTAVLGRSSYSDMLAKYLRHADILARAAAESPQCTRTAYYLAKSYEDGDAFAHSMPAYARRIGMNSSGYNQERYMSAFRLARVAQYLSSANNAHMTAVTALVRHEGISVRGSMRTSRSNFAVQPQGLASPQADAREAVVLHYLQLAGTIDPSRLEHVDELIRFLRSTGRVVEAYRQARMCRGRQHMRPRVALSAQAHVYEHAQAECGSLGPMLELRKQWTHIARLLKAAKIVGVLPESLLVVGGGATEANGLYQPIGSSGEEWVKHITDGKNASSAYYIFRFKEWWNLQQRRAPNDRNGTWMHVTYGARLPPTWLRARQGHNVPPFCCSWGAKQHNRQWRGQNPMPIVIPLSAALALEAQFGAELNSRVAPITGSPFSHGHRGVTFRAPQSFVKVVDGKGGDGVHGDDNSDDSDSDDNDYDDYDDSDAQENDSTSTAALDEMVDILTTVRGEIDEIKRKQHLQKVPEHHQMCNFHHVQDRANNAALREAK